MRYARAAVIPHERGVHRAVNKRNQSSRVFIPHRNAASTFAVFPRSFSKLARYRASKKLVSLMKRIASMPLIAIRNRFRVFRGN
jgi:hypothetical protein